MNESNIKPPGVNIDGISGFPNPVVPIATAIPAFIGYTPQAMYEGKSYINVPQKITSLADFQAIFCYPDPSPPLSPAKQYSPEYYLVKEKNKPEKGNYLMIGTDYYSIVPDPNTIYYLYNSIKFFYENGGGDAYIVSVGTYGKPSKSPISPGDQIVNSNVKLNDLLNGLALLKNEIEPTMYICPEATLLSLKNNGVLMQKMLLQNTEIRTAVSIFDIIGGRNSDPIMWTEDIKTFRNNTGMNGLSFGAAYYPFIGTKIMHSEDIDYTNLFGGDLKQLELLLNPPAAPNKSIAKIFSSIENPHCALSVCEYNNELLKASKTYAAIIKHVLSDVNLLPPSGAIAGKITITDNLVGPWEAPVKISIAGAAYLPIRLSHEQQAELISGKSINPIRFFNGLGFLIWGAKTLDGNSLDLKYLSVRRTIIFLEQSCKQATNAYTFKPNIKNTWEEVKAMISSFLSTIWKEGVLQGETPKDSFSVECGLGSTMTAEDILNGIMRVVIKVAIVHPAEFILISFEQEMTITKSS